MTNTIIRCFWNSDLRCQHEGLRLVAESAMVNTNKLSKGEFVVFVNSARSKVKILTHKNLLVYARTPGNHRMQPEDIEEIPKAFSGSKFSMKKMIRNSLIKQMNRKN